MWVWASGWLRSSPGSTRRRPHAEQGDEDVDQPVFHRDVVHRPDRLRSLRRWLHGSVAPSSVRARGGIQRLRFLWHLLQRLVSRIVSRSEYRRLRYAMASASNYNQWREAATQLDSLEGLDEWKRAPLPRPGAYGQKSFTADEIDSGVIQERLLLWGKFYSARDYRNLSIELRAGLLNASLWRDITLFQRTHCGTKQDVEDYINVAAYLLDRIADDNIEKGDSNGSSESPPSALALHEKLVFFNETRHAYGRTALLLSGGASMGLVHLGVVKALYDNGLLPTVLSGTSAGAMVAATTCVMTESELGEFLHSKDLILPQTGAPCSFSFFDNVSIGRKLRRFLKKGSIHDVRWFQGTVRRNLGEYTFEEAYARTGRILNITVTPMRSSDPPLLLNYLTSPHVLIWSAVCASAALPMIFAPIQLLAKDSTGKLVPYHPDGVRWVDGSIKFDIPITRVGELFNVNHFIVSQVNPHVVPRGSWLLRNRLSMILKSEIKFRYSQLVDLKLVPQLTQIYIHHFMQPFGGDVTIMPSITCRDLFQLIRNPTIETVHQFIERGEHLTYPKIDQIRHHCLVELVSCAAP